MMNACIYYSIAFQYVLLSGGIHYIVLV